MASQYPHGHAYDLFVSYSTRDLDWVRVFHDDLVTDTNRFCELDVFPFLDKVRLQPGYIWNEEILAAATDSAIFVPVLSPRFFQSDYCQKELRAFMEAHGLTSGSVTRSPILPVKLLCSAPSNHPLAQVQTVSFCTERDDDIPFEHQPGTQQYKEALRKLAVAIGQVLKTVPSKLQRRGAAYLALDSKPSTDKLRAPFEHHFDVLPENPHSFRASESLVKLTVRGTYSNEKLRSAQPWREIGHCRFHRDFEVAADPVFDLVVENTSGGSLLLLKIGIRILQRKPGIGGVMGYPQPIKVQAEYSVHCYEEWKRFNLNDDEVWNSFEDPICMKMDDSPFRFTLCLENFCDTDNASSSEIRFFLQTSSGTVESESIWLEQ